MGLYHPCKIVEILKGDKEVSASDNTIQLIVEAWDELQWTISLDPELIKEKIGTGDIVLVDWSIENETKAPKMNAVKILRGKKAESAWKSYKDYLKKQKQKVAFINQEKQHASSYMG